MANVHRVYDIFRDCYCVRVEGSENLYTFSGRQGEKDSYAKLRQLIAQEQKTDKMSKMIDHAQHL